MFVLRLRRTVQSMWNLKILRWSYNAGYESPLEPQFPWLELEIPRRNPVCVDVPKCPSLPEPKARSTGYSLESDEHFACAVCPSSAGPPESWQALAAVANVAFPAYQCAGGPCFMSLQPYSL